MRKSRILLVVSVAVSFLLSGFVLADELPTPKGGFLTARIAAKKIKKIDTDNDGKLSHEECEKYQKEHEKAEADEKTAAGKDSEAKK